MKVDIGCGCNKQPGYFGIDCREIPEADLVWDINKPIPLPDNSIEFVMASRSLSYVDNLFSVLGDLYRLCAHKAVMCILAPYAHSFVHLTNPNVKQRFDESSPRYWTSHFHEPSHGTSCPPPSPYEGEEPPFDFRLLRMEFRYAPEFSPPDYELEELEMLQRVQSNVVDEILYYVVAVKAPISQEELERLEGQIYPLPIVLEKRGHEGSK